MVTSEEGEALVPMPPSVPPSETPTSSSASSSTTIPMVVALQGLSTLLQRLMGAVQSTSLATEPPRIGGPGDGDPDGKAEKQAWKCLLEEVRLLSYVGKLSLAPESSPVWEGPLGSKIRAALEAWMVGLMEVTAEGAEPEKLDEDIERYRKEALEKALVSGAAKPKVLIVARSPTLALQLAMKAQAQGFFPHVVHTTLQALNEAAEGRPYRALVTEQTGVLMQGAELIERLRRSGGEGWSTAYIVLVQNGADGDENVEELGRRAGADLAVASYEDVSFSQIFKVLEERDRFQVGLNQLSQYASKYTGCGDRAGSGRGSRRSSSKQEEEKYTSASSSCASSISSCSSPWEEEEERPARGRSAAASGSKTDVVVKEAATRLAEGSNGNEKSNGTKHLNGVVAPKEESNGTASGKSSGQNSTTVTSVPPSQQPNRVKRACAYCHAKKVVCSGVRPCTRCVSLNIACTEYEPKPRTTRRNPPANNVNAGPSTAAPVMLIARRPMGGKGGHHGAVVEEDNPGGAPGGGGGGGSSGGGPLPLPTIIAPIPSTSAVGLPPHAPPLPHPMAAPGAMWPGYDYANPPPDPLQWVQGYPPMPPSRPTASHKRPPQHRHGGGRRSKQAHLEDGGEYGGQNGDEEEAEEGESEDEEEEEEGTARGVMSPNQYDYHQYPLPSSNSATLSDTILRQFLMTNPDLYMNYVNSQLNLAQQQQQERVLQQQQQAASGKDQQGRRRHEGRGGDRDGGEGGGQEPPMRYGHHHHRHHQGQKLGRMQTT